MCCAYTVVLALVAFAALAACLASLHLKAVASLSADDTLSVGTLRSRVFEHSGAAAVAVLRADEAVRAPRAESAPVAVNVQLINCGGHLQSADGEALDSALACWEDVVRKFSPRTVSSTDGQVTSGQPFCRSLANLAAQPHVELALELGTWKGGGSSLCMGKAFARTAGRLITVEFVIDMWLQARKTLAPYPVACVLGATIPAAELPSEADVVAAGGVSAPGSPTDARWTTWLAADRKGAEAQPEGLAVLEPLCKANVFDLVVLDGGEFSGIPEWAAIERDQVLAEWDGATGKWTKGIRYVAMDDTRTYKNRANFKEFTASSEWTLLEGNQAERNGWAIFERAKRDAAVAVPLADEVVRAPRPETAPVAVNVQLINCGRHLQSADGDFGSAPNASAAWWIVDNTFCPFSFCPTLEYTESPAPHISTKLKENNCVTSNMGIMDTLLPTNDGHGIVVDVGANDGSDYSLHAIRKGYLVYAFEPVKSTADLFVQTMKTHGFGNKVSVVRVTPGEPAVVPKTPLADHVVLFVAAAGARTSKMSISLSAIHETTSLIAGNGNGEGSNNVDIAVVKLDDLISAAQRVKLMKIDAQGFEPEVLRGASRLLGHGKIDKITLEFWPKGIERGGNNPVRMLEVLWRKGWQCFDWSTNDHISNDRPSDFVGFVGAFYQRYGGQKCHDEACWKFGLWDELFCAPTGQTMAAVDDEAAATDADDRSGRGADVENERRLAAAATPPAITLSPASISK